jgi:hypothetical protein
MKRVSVLCFVLAVLVLPGSSCAEDPDYFPIVPKGVVMEYSVESYDHSRSETKKYKKTFRFEDEVELDGKRYFKQVVVLGLPGAGTTPFIFYRRWAKDGIIKGTIFTGPNILKFHSRFR